MTAATALANAFLEKDARGSRRGTEDEARLVRRAQRGDQTAFAAIVERYQSKVLSTVRATLHHTNDIDDIAQQVFVKVYVGIAGFDARGSLWAWMYRITINECFDYLRKKRVRPLVYESDLGGSEDAAGYVLSVAPSAEAAADRHVEDKQLAAFLLQQVSEMDRFLLLMKEVEGASIAELSKATGLSENCVKIKLFRARKRMVKAARRINCPAPGARKA